MSRRLSKTRRTAAESNTYRFFVPAGALHGGMFESEDADLAHQFANVLRLQMGDHVVLLDNTGWQYTVALTGVERRRVAGTIERKEPGVGEPRTKITLYTGLMRAERFEWVLQKGTELGVSAFVPLICERSAFGDAGELSERKVERWERLIREAAEQACRARLPQLGPALFFGPACQQTPRRGSAFILWEGKNAIPLRAALDQALAPRDAGTEPGDAPAAPEREIDPRMPASRETSDLPHQAHHESPFADTQDRRITDALPLSFAIFSGPEGGLSTPELESARSDGIIPVTLGPRILRAETAPLVAATAILYTLGDLE